MLDCLIWHETRLNLFVSHLIRGVYKPGNRIALAYPEIEGNKHRTRDVTAWRRLGFAADIVVGYNMTDVWRTPTWRSYLPTYNTATTPPTGLRDFLTNLNPKEKRKIEKYLSKHTYQNVPGLRLDISYLPVIVESAQLLVPRPINRVVHTATWLSPNGGVSTRDSYKTSEVLVAENIEVN